MVNKELFKEVMRNNNDTIIKLSQELHISRQALYYKLDSVFTSSEIEFFKQRWKLSPIGVDKIFLGGEEQNDNNR